MANANCGVIGRWQRSGSLVWRSNSTCQIREDHVRAKSDLVKCWAYQGWMKPVPVVANGPQRTRGVLITNMWLGPACQRELNANRFRSFNFPLVLGDFAEAGLMTGSWEFTRLTLRSMPWA